MVGGTGRRRRASATAAWPRSALVVLVAAVMVVLAAAAPLAARVAARGRRRHGRRRGRWRSTSPASARCPTRCPLPSLPAGVGRADQRPALGAAFAVALLAAHREPALGQGRRRHGRTPAATTPTGSCSARASPTSPRRSSVACPPPARSPAPRSTSAPVPAPVSRPSSTRSSSCVVVLFGGPLVAEIPLAALAGVLMVTAVRMVEVHNVRAVSALDPLATRSCSSLTAGATIAFDLIVAVEIGVAVAAVLALRVARPNRRATVEPSRDRPTRSTDDDRGSDLLARAHRHATASTARCSSAPRSGSSPSSPRSPTSGS